VTTILFIIGIGAGLAIFLIYLGCADVIDIIIGGGADIIVFAIIGYDISNSYTGSFYILLSM